MRARHTWNEFAQEEATVRADAGKEVVDVAHDVKSTNSYIILKVIQMSRFSI